MPKGIYPHKIIPVAQRFWPNVIKTDGCWLWAGYQDACGYGRLLYKGLKATAQRVAWKITYGEIPDGLLVMHRCDNPPCVNPSHLFLGTPGDNLRDAVNKGRLNLVAAGIKRSIGAIRDGHGRYTPSAH